MRMIDLIEQKRDGGELSPEQISFFIEKYTADEIPDYQAAALLMAIFIRGMNRRETVALTQAMARSGEQLDLHDVAPFVVDKHSSGGVGDKTTLVVQPLVAACGVPVGKMSGRGLGSSGGTLDKMESFTGWSFQMTLPQFKAAAGRNWACFGRTVSFVSTRRWQTLCPARCNGNSRQQITYCRLDHVKEIGGRG